MQTIKWTSHASELIGAPARLERGARFANSSHLEVAKCCRWLQASERANCDGEELDWSINHLRREQTSSSAKLQVTGGQPASQSVALGRPEARVFVCVC